jgi:hypothetical protein
MEKTKPRHGRNSADTADNGPAITTTLWLPLYFELTTSFLPDKLLHCNTIYVRQTTRVPSFLMKE